MWTYIDRIITQRRVHEFSYVYFICCYRMLVSKIYVSHSQHV